MTSPGPSSLNIWAAAYVPPAPDRVPCKGADPALFDLALDGEHLIHDRGTRRVTYAFQSQVAVALSYCATCPLATRQWCLETVRPRESGANTIAGGIAWVGGKPRWDLADQEQWEAAS